MTLTLQNLKGVNPFQKKTTRTKRAFLRDFEGFIDGLGSNGQWGKGDVGTAGRVPGYVAGTMAANAVVTPTGVNAADTVTINGQALTAIQQRSTGTVTAAAVLAADTVTMNGVVFTAVNGSPVGNQFDMSGSNTACATSLAAAINACATAGVLGVVAAKSSAAVVTVFAVVPGTAGNSLTLASSNGGRLAISGATFSGGIAVANNQFDMAGTDITTGASLADCINASSTAIVSSLTKGGARSATITLTGTTDGQTVTVGNVTFRAKNGAAGSLFDVDQFDVSGNDTAKATSLTSQINAHPFLSSYVWADSSTNVVTVRERPPVTPTLTGAASALSVSPSAFPTPISALPLLKNGAGIAVSAAQLAASAAVLIESVVVGAVGNAQTIATSNGARLPILGGQTRLINGADTTNTF
jgi:hypothetical protein